jgi:hypothetical protein
LASVRWGFKSKNYVADRSKLGLFSSRIIDTKVPLANEFSGGLDQTQYLTFLLYYIAGDGSVLWEYLRNNDGAIFLKYRALTLTARCPEIINILEQLLNCIGFKNITVKSNTMRDKNYKTLYIPNNQDNNNPMLDTLYVLENEGLILHPKLRFLQEFLKSDVGHIPERFGPPNRKSFLEYLGSSYPDNKAACIIGQ